MKSLVALDIACVRYGNLLRFKDLFGCRFYVVHARLFASLGQKLWESCILRWDQYDQL